ncbi:DUF222 domain-containing protein [Arthrobacter sp. YAF17]|uniref:DUF222 domain-containing protein n=1 Tax=Arthrobacter sp. YAF17 TaxID=3233077 RepID=UPI003F8FF93B
MDGNLGPDEASAAAGTATVADVVRALAAVRPARDSVGLINQIRELEDAKSAAAASQARLSVAFDLLQRREQSDAGMPAAELGAGVGAQVALARRESPAKGSRLLGLAKALVTEMPRTLAALDKGKLNEWRATILVRETACLSGADRAGVDEELVADAGTFDGAGDRAIIAAARAAAYRRDPRTVTQRSSHAATERHVSIRPAPDTMCYFTALLPVSAGVAMHAALTRHADSLRSAGDPRTRGQLMADSLVERTTGTPGGITGIEIQLVVTDRTLFQGDIEPARLPGYGIVPAGWARELLKRGGKSAGARQDPKHGTGPGGGVAGIGAGRARAEGTDKATDTADDDRDLSVWLRRLYTAPGANGAGLCEACNHTKEASGWKVRHRPGPRHTLEIQTPTGHTYQSAAPPLPETKLAPPRRTGPPRTRTAPSAGQAVGPIAETSNHRRTLRHQAKTRKLAAKRHPVAA